MKTHCSNNYLNVAKILVYISLQDEGISGIVTGSFIHAYIKIRLEAIRECADSISMLLSVLSSSKDVLHFSRSTFSSVPVKLLKLVAFSEGTKHIQHSTIITA